MAMGSVREGGKLGECRRIVWRQFVAWPASKCLDAIVGMPAIVHGGRMIALDDGRNGEWLMVFGYSAMMLSKMLATHRIGRMIIVMLWLVLLVLWMLLGGW